MNAMTLKEKRTGLVLNVLLLLLCLIFLFPLYWLIVTSLKTELDIFKTPPLLFPSRINLQPYIEQFASEQYNLYQAFFNSGIISVGTMVLSTVLAIPAAYGLARFQTKGKSCLFLFS